MCDHLFQLTRVDLHATRLGPGAEDQLDVIPDQPLEHRHHPRHDRIEIENLGSQHLLATESQQLLRQGRGPLGRLLNELEISPQRARGFDATQRGLPRDPG
jgi:hypothetical protein